MAKLPVIPVPAGFRFQPVDAGEVAGRLVELTLGTPARLVPDMGGPRVYGVAESAPRIPAGARQAPDDGAGPDPRQGRPRVPGRRKSSYRTGCGSPDLGGLPSRTGEFAGRQQIHPGIAAAGEEFRPMANSGAAARSDAEHSAGASSGRSARPLQSSKRAWAIFAMVPQSSPVHRPLEASGQKTRTTFVRVTEIRQLNQAAVLVLQFEVGSPRSLDCAPNKAVAVASQNVNLEGQ
jgi:hypothetical protein